MAYQFTTASSQYLSVADTAALDVTGALTLAAWVKSSGSYGANRGIATKWRNFPTNSRSYALIILTNGAPQFAISTSGNFEAANGVNGSSAIGTNWAHVAGVLNPSTRQELFVNAALDSAKTTSVAAGIFSGDANFEIGRFFASDLSTWDGDIAEVGIWNTNLTPEEIASLADGMTCDKVRPQSLVFYAPLVRDLVDAKGGLTITNNNTATVANHPRVYA